MCGSIPVPKRKSRKSQYSKISSSSKPKEELTSSPNQQSSQIQTTLANRSLLEESPLKVSQYKQVTLGMFRQIRLIKHLMQDNEGC